jgi:RNase P subunit p30
MRVAAVQTQGSGAYASYDILAVQPTSEKALQLACATLDIDIITFNASERMTYYPKRTTLRQAVDRGIYFELNYAPAIRGMWREGGDPLRERALSSSCGRQIGAEVHDLERPEPGPGPARQERHPVQRGRAGV